MHSDDLYGFSSDQPILSKDEDLLERGPFSESLATAIANWHGKESLVVALNGDWGSGKTSIKNIAVLELEKIKENKPQVIEFSPWEWAAQEKITSTFFQEISSAIGRVDKSKEGKKLADKIRKYGQYINAGGYIAQGLFSSLPLLVSLFALLGISVASFLSGTQYAAIISIVVPAFTGFILLVPKLFNSIAGILEKNSQKNEQGLPEIRKEIKELLFERDSSIVIVMDDLDRLTSEQIKMVFQLIKSNLVFPKLVFLLLFQRDLVEDKLTEGKQSGREYLEKIVQVPFDIPKIEPSRIHEILFKQLDKILLQDKNASETFDLNYWRRIFSKSLHVYFNNIRNVYRYTSTLSFHFSMLKGTRVFEVNPVDLMAIECLRVFEPEVYNELYQAKEAFTSHMKDSSGLKNDTIKNSVHKVIDKAIPENKDTITELLKLIFPNVKWVFENSYYDYSFSTTWNRGLRVCYSSHFSQYFKFSTTEGELTNSDLDELLFSTSDAAQFASLIISKGEKKGIKNVLSRFEAYIDNIPLDHGAAFIMGLLGIGDDIDSQNSEFMFYSAHTQAERLVYNFLQRIKDVNERGGILLECYKKSNGISLIETLLQNEENYRKKNQQDILLSDLSFIDLKNEFVNKLNDMAANHSDKLLNHSHLGSFLYRWKRWGSAEIVSDWVSNQAKHADTCLLLLKALSIKSTTHSTGSDESKNEYRFNIKDAEQFVSIDLLINTINLLNIDALDEKSQLLIEAFNQGLKNKDRGDERF